MKKQLYLWTKKFFIVRGVENYRMRENENKNFHIGLVFNRRKKNINPDSIEAEYDSYETVNAIKKAIEENGHSVGLIEADEKIFERLKKSKIDLAFNIAEGPKINSRESLVPLLLEMLGIPYTGSSPLTLAVGLDKAKTKEILLANGIRTPAFQVFKNPEEKLRKSLEFPLIVKPVCEGSSMGITNDSVVANEKELRRQLKFVFEKFNEPALVEEFIEGREFSAAIIQNGQLSVLPIVEFDFGCLPEHAKKIDSFEAKWVWDTAEKPLPLYICPARITEQEKEKIEQISIAAFEALDCRDLCRIDLREKNGKFFVLEINPLPGLNPDINSNSVFPTAIRASGMGFSETIGKIIENALKRNGLCG
ncbi:MAG: ATP-grasp domain-containing protein [Candidatus ainarchaeum sp.]|nr:ATP-grasp domain-containing protein [Candidatus ainarchaeum sp.]